MCVCVCVCVECVTRACAARFEYICSTTRPRPSPLLFPRDKTAPLAAAHRPPARVPSARAFWGGARTHARQKHHQSTHAPLWPRGAALAKVAPRSTDTTRPRTHPCFVLFPQRAGTFLCSSQRCCKIALSRTSKARLFCLCQCCQLVVARACARAAAAWEERTPWLRRRCRRPSSRRAAARRAGHESSLCRTTSSCRSRRRRRSNVVVTPPPSRRSPLKLPTRAAIEQTTKLWGTARHQ